MRKFKLHNPGGDCVSYTEQVKNDLRTLMLKSNFDLMVRKFVGYCTKFLGLAH